MQAGHKHHQGEMGHLGGSHVVLGSACQEGRVDVVPWGRGHPVEEALVQSDEAEGDGSVVGVDPEDQ